MTKDEAIEMVREMNQNEDPEQFCPLINGPCRKDCVCWKQAMIRSEQTYSPSHPKENWEIIGFECTNAMFAQKVIQLEE